MATVLQAILTSWPFWIAVAAVVFLILFRLAHGVHANALAVDTELGWFEPIGSLLVMVQWLQVAVPIESRGAR